MRRNDYKIFISHAGADAWVAKQIQVKIAKLGIRTFLDDGGINVGDDFEKIILGELQDSKELLVVFTPWAQKRPYVWLEIGAAWGLKRRIVGVLYGVTVEQISAEGSNPALLKRTNMIDINSIEKYFAQLKKRVLKLSR